MPGRPSRRQIRLARRLKAQIRDVGLGPTAPDLSDDEDPPAARLDRDAAFETLAPGVLP